MKSRILIIEDNNDVRENLSEILHLSGYQTYTAANGKEGVKAALEHLPDLILCDIMMPELDGYGVLRILSKNPALAQTPFLFLSAKTELADIRKGMSMGADDYITKPFDDVELLDTIEVRLKKKSGSHAPGNSLKSVLTAPQLVDMMPSAWQENERRQVRKKDLLYSEGQVCRSVYLLHTGRAIATKTDAYSKEVVTRLYLQDDFIGLSSAMVGNRFRESVRAFEDLTVLPIRHEDFLEWVTSDQAVAYYFMRVCALHHLEAEEKLLLQAFGSVRMKLAATLISLHRAYAENGKAVIPVSREDLAGMAGTAKETIIRCLSEFKDEGLVTLDGSNIVLDSVKPLTQMAY